MTNMDKLYEAVEARGPVCVGLDTDFSYLPEDFVDSTLSRGENIVRFNRKLIDATKAVAGCYKVQIAYYESLGLEGMKAYACLLYTSSKTTRLPLSASPRMLSSRCATARRACSVPRSSARCATASSWRSRAAWQTTPCPTVQVHWSGPISPS